VRLDDRAAYGKAHAQARGLGSEEGIEYSVEDFGGHFLSLIADRDFDRAVAGRGGMDREMP
jgi:hypothetical protein